MPLCREQPFADIDALDLGGGATAPDVDVPVMLFRQEMGSRRGRRIYDMVLVHLMQMDLSAFRIIEEPSADRGQGDGGMCQFPFAVGGGIDLGAEGAAEDLVAEADAAEADIGALLPES